LRCDWLGALFYLCEDCNKIKTKGDAGNIAKLRNIEKKRRKTMAKKQIEKPNNKCPTCGKLSYFPQAYPEAGAKLDNLYCTKKCGKKAGLTNEELEGD